MMKSFISLVAAVVLGGNFLAAQSVEDGKKFFYYKRYKSARETFEKIVNANPNNIEAVYWLGQTLIEQGDSTAAKEQYQKLLTQNGNAPLVLAGMGQIELMEGKTNDARQRFESAISLTKGRDVDVFNAVARANIQAKAGDANYAIEKLTQATQVKRFNDPTTYLLMGDAYRKLIDGGNAVQNYEKAFSMNNNLAEAKFNIAKIYLTQQNYSMYLKYMQEAIHADANYAPAYYDLYVYYYERDVHLSKENLEKYTAVADKTPELEYDQVTIYYAARDFQTAIEKAKEKIQQYGEKADPRYYKLIAYSYAELKDTTNAKPFMDQYFTVQKPSGYVPKDFSFHAQLLSKFPGNEAEAFAKFEKAVELDTALTGKLQLMDEAAKLAKSMGDHAQEANWYGKIYRTDPNASNRDLYNYGFALYQAQMFDSAYAVFKTYQEKYPDEIYGYLWGSRAAQGIDSTFEQGLAATEYEIFAREASRIDSVKFKSQIIFSYKLLAQYYNNVKKDADSAILYLEKVAAIDPQDEAAKKFLDMLKKARQEAEKRNTGSTSSAPKKPNGGSSPNNKK
jgi:tetratricopeptide (TPR) repeat protein